MTAASAERVKVWDAWVRLTHWLVAALVPVAWWTAEKGMMAPHRLAGYAIMALVLFRLWWGVAGSSTARFASFVKGPRAFLGYARTLLDGSSRTVGHNPMGGWSVVALLVLLVAVTALGLFAVDIDGFEPGPLGRFVSFDQGRVIAHWHELTFWALVAVIALHIAAVVFYLVVRRENLVGAMIGGYKRDVGDHAPPRFAPVWLAVLGAALAAGATWWISKGLRWPPF